MTMFLVIGFYDSPVFCDDKASFASSSGAPKNIICFTLTIYIECVSLHDGYFFPVLLSVPFDC